MSNLKVFELAKEIGVETLVLMDKIKKWDLPVRNHMTELPPDLVAEIREKLDGESSKSAPKKVAAKKVAKKKTATVKAAPKASPKGAAAPATKKVVRKKATGTVKTTVVAASQAVEDAPSASLSESAEVRSSSVVRRKAGALKQAERAEEAAAITLGRPAVEQMSEINQNFVSPAVQEPSENRQENMVSSQLSGDVSLGEPVATPKATKSEESSPLEMEKSAVQTANQGQQLGGTSAAGLTDPTAIGSRIVRTPRPRENIVGRIDLKRFEPRERTHTPRQTTTYTPNNAAGAQGGPNSRPPMRPQRTAPRNLRPGFVSAPTTPEPTIATAPRRGEDRTRNKPKVAVAPVVAKAAPTEEPPAFITSEFRKREIVFQPKKKKVATGQVKMTEITTPSAHKRIVEVFGTITVLELAQAMNVKAPKLMGALMKSGVLVKMASSVDFDTAALIAPEFGFEAVNVEKSPDELIKKAVYGDLAAEGVERAAVVTVMGHVDHGKTSLLDAIRKADVVSGEAGGITQHIGAYSVKTESGKIVTFIDTPGHAAFTAMRARGANCTDVAIVVVAADDGVMPQTEEAISHAKNAGVPIIVALNKIDKPDANPEKVKQQLTEFGLVPEDWGGDTIFCPVSATKKTGLKELLEQIHLVAEISELKANPKRSASGVVIESKLDKGRGAVATLLIQDGTLKQGDFIVAGKEWGRVRSLMNDKGERVSEAGPSMPVEVLGLSGAPLAGDRFDATLKDSQALAIAELRAEMLNKYEATTPASKITLEELFSKVKTGDFKELPVVLKTDVAGSSEAIRGMLAKLSNSEVRVKVIHDAVGGISESDVLLASTAKGLIIGFNVRPDNSALKMSEREGIEIRTYSIVYELIDDMKKALSGLLAPEMVEKTVGHAEVRETFSVPKIGVIAGCMVQDGRAHRNDLIRVLRNGKIVYTGKLESLKRFKDDAREVQAGYECGMNIENFNDIKVGDIIEFFTQEHVAREFS